MLLSVELVILPGAQRQNPRAAWGLGQKLHVGGHSQRRPTLVAGIHCLGNIQWWKLSLLRVWACQLLSGILCIVRNNAGMKTQGLGHAQQVLFH